MWVSPSLIGRRVAMVMDGVHADWPGRVSVVAGQIPGAGQVRGAGRGGRETPGGAAGAAPRSPGTAAGSTQRAEGS